MGSGYMFIALYYTDSINMWSFFFLLIGSQCIRATASSLLGYGIFKLSFFELLAPYQLSTVSHGSNGLACSLHGCNLKRNVFTKTIAFQFVCMQPSQQVYYIVLKYSTYLQFLKEEAGLPNFTMTHF